MHSRIHLSENSIVLSFCPFYTASDRSDNAVAKEYLIPCVVATLNWLVSEISRPGMDDFHLTSAKHQRHHWQLVQTSHVCEIRRPDLKRKAFAVPIDLPFSFQRFYLNENEPPNLILLFVRKAGTRANQTILNILSYTFLYIMHPDFESVNLIQI